MRQVRCYQDCIAQETGEPADCDCAQRDAMAYDAEMEARADRLRDNWTMVVYEKFERDRARALPGERRMYERE